VRIKIKQDKEVKKMETKKQAIISLVPLFLKKIIVPVKGKTPLLMNRQSEEVKQGILAKQTGKSQSSKKMIRNIEQETKDSIHFFPDGKTIGFPANGFKAGMIEATSFVGDKFFSKKLVKGLNIVNTTNGLVKIDFAKQDILEHQINGAVTKFTPQFHDWKTTLTIEFDANNISEQDILTLINYAGHYIGVGSWNPKSKCGGSYGTYMVATK
jgi:hypothetical protein